jgi:hypothetical protein
MELAWEVIASGTEVVTNTYGYDAFGARYGQKSGAVSNFTTKAIYSKCASRSANICYTQRSCRKLEWPIDFSAP